MMRPGLLMTHGICMILAASSWAWAGDGMQPLPPINQGQAIDDFQAAHPEAKFHEQAGRITRVYGPAFSTGVSAEASAENFRVQHADLWGLQAADLAARGPWEAGHHLQPISYDSANDTYKFTGVYYAQQRDGIEVYRSRMMVLTRNVADHGAVLVSADLRNLGGYRVTPAMLASVNARTATQVALQAYPQAAVIVPPRTVIFAGVDDWVQAPVLAVVFALEGGTFTQGNLVSKEIVADAATGAVLYEESLIHDLDITGNVSGMATEGNGADVCGPEAIMPLPYARVSIGATIATADINGNFTIPNAGTSAVQADSIISGQYFNVFNPASVPATTLSQNVTPPGPVNFIHNAANTSATNLAEVNVYIHANKVRDFALAQNPAYPVIGGQQGATAMRVNVNIAATCNAFYFITGQTINFYQSGGGCSNTANSTVVHHEYGHHLVQMGGSGQGAFGEGMGDTMAALITDDSCLGNGFQACGTCLRNANNNCLYQTSGCSSCGSEIHACGQLISGCVWSTRNALQVSNPATYLSIISNLAVNSILVHTGALITPAITIDYLTLDDTDGDIANGTPHYNEIAAGFGAHNMPAPPLALIAFAYPNGRPDFVSPSGGTTMRVQVNPNVGSPQPGTAMLHINTGSGFVPTAMTQISPNVYDAVFPAAPCGTQLRYYISAQSTTAVTQTSPNNAPLGTFSAISAFGPGTIVLQDDFQTDMGWTTSVAGATSGQWQRVVPVPLATCNRGNPGTDGDASGMCFVTQNGGPGVCDTDIDGGTVTLTSPIMDASQGAPLLTYWRWYHNTFGATPGTDIFVVEFSTNGGTTWTNLETVGPNASAPNPEVNGGWFQKAFNLNAVAGFAPTNQFRVRFVASDLGAGSVVEAGIDGVKLQSLQCNGLQGDINNDGFVNVNDLLAVVGAWGPCPASCPADITNNGVVDVNDLLIVVGNWTG